MSLLEFELLESPEASRPHHKDVRSGPVEVGQKWW